MEEEIKKDDYGCRLIINTGDDHPDIITATTGIISTSIVVKGSSILRPVTKEIVEGKYYDYNLCVYDIGKKHVDEGYYLNAVLEEMLDSVDRKKINFVDLLRKYPLNHILCYAYFYDFHSYFILDKNLSQRLSRYNIDIEFDLYYLG